MDDMILPDAPWRHRPGLAALCGVLGADGGAGGGATRIVGGAVRDTLLGIDVADIDLATRHAPADVLDLLRASGIKAVPTGLAHGTITAILPDGPIEVTTLRRDVATDGRHAVIAFTDDWREDAARRDFTINALYADPSSGEIFDYFEGLGDLAARRVRFIGDPLQRIAEDHLRILRFFRFLARFGDTPDPAALAACAARANDLMALSRERIATEMMRLLVARGAVAVTALMVERGILKPVLPEIDVPGVARLERLAQREAAAAIPPDAIRRLAALLPAAPAVHDDVGARLKLSNAERKRLTGAALPVGDAPAAVIGYRLGTPQAIDRLLLSERPAEEAAQLIDSVPPAFPLSGGALVERGVSKGRDVARLLREIEDQWLAEGFPAAARVSDIADAAVESWLRSVRNA